MPSSEPLGTSRITGWVGWRLALQGKHAQFIILRTDTLRLRTKHFASWPTASCLPPSEVPPFSHNFSKWTVRIMEPSVMNPSAHITASQLKYVAFYNDQSFVMCFSQFWNQHLTNVYSVIRCRCVFKKKPLPWTLTARRTPAPSRELAGITAMLGGEGRHYNCWAHGFPASTSVQISAETRSCGLTNYRVI